MARDGDIRRRLSPPGKTQRTSLEQEEQTAGESDDGQKGSDPKEGREELGGTCGCRILPL
jgi:hypothetical protein